jgi:alpha-beta hydrolase superfamily lysophospholipase
MSFTSIRRNWTLAALAIATFAGVGKTTVARTPSPTPAPLFQRVASYSTTIAANRNPADIYYPQQSAKAHRRDRFPVALLLPGANVDKSNYEDFARIVASYGFVVVVPNQQRSLPQFGFTGLLPDTSQIDAVLKQIKTEKSNSTPIAKIVDSQNLVLLGHSAGGAVGLSAIGNLCIAPVLCETSFKRPKELVGGAFFGANLRDQATQEYIPIKNSGVPIALIQGDRDGIALPERAQATYDNIQSPPKALITVSGANHYGIADANNPPGAVPDPNTPQIEQSQAVETVARWSALFLRAEVLGDRQVFDYVYKTGDALDKNVSVISQQ